MALFQRMVRDLFVPLSLWRNHELAQIRYLREFERSQFLSAEALRELQLGRLRSLLAHAFAECPFYRRRFEQADLRPEAIRNLEDLRALPVLEKREIQQHGPDLVARNWPAADLLPNCTGGSTGTPLAFFLSTDRKCARAAATLRHNRWAGWEIGDKAAVLWGAPRDRPPAGWLSRLRGALLREPLWLDTAHVTEGSLARFHAALHDYRPKILQAYAGAAVLFARYLRSVGHSAYRPHALVTSAEVLDPPERALLEEVFQCPVFNRYGCREVSVIASECPAHSGMHAMAEGLFVEIETPQGPAAPGQMGSILVTDLLNRAMPLIRYRIGDLGSWAPGICSCGRSLPRLQQVAGRVTDFLVGSERQLVSGVFLATYVIAQRPSLGQVQIRQDRPGAVLYRVIPGAAFDPLADREYLQSATRRYLGQDTTVELELVANLPHASSGKFLFSHSTVAAQFLGTADEARGPALQTSNGQLKSHEFALRN